MELLRKQMQKIFEKVQDSTARHQKSVILLSQLYKNAQHDQFIQIFLNFLQMVVQEKVENSVYVKRILSFVSRFCSDITKKEANESETHNFFTDVMLQILQWSCLDCFDVRYNCCVFITMVLQDIGEEVQLDVELIDEIQRVLLARMQESKVSIRLVTMSALVRLQIPNDFDCPVINAYINALSCSSAHVRKDAVQYIAPNLVTLSKIKDRVKDVDPAVRSMAFHKCGDIAPLNFRIVDKQMILMCGFKETVPKVKTTFLDYLLPKWLTAYEGNYVKFLAALKLLADDEDMKKMVYLSKLLIKEFYSKHPILDLIAVLPINDMKLINIEDLNIEVSLFWCLLVELLRESDDMDDHLNSILPELTPFCQYIERFVASKSAETMDEWKLLDYQFNLLNLLEIAENYDLGDEVGRRTIQSVATTLLQNHSFIPKIIQKLVFIAHKCSTNIEFFTNDMCQIISEIREPFTDQPLSQDERRKRDFQAAELRVNINVLEEKQNEAVERRDYQSAQMIENELSKCRKQLEVLQAVSGTEKVRVARSDPGTICRCLDILSSVLGLSAVTKLTPSLTACRDLFLVPLISNQNAEIHWRMIKCLGQFSLADKATAEEYSKIIGIPIVTYRTVPINHIEALIQSIMGVTDLITMYGIEIVGGEEEPSSNTTQGQNATKRKLYSCENEDAETEKTEIDKVTISYFLEIFLDMLDDEREEIRHKAVFAVTTLIESFPVTPGVLSRILLKWSSPLTEKHDSRLQVLLGLSIDQYMRLKNSGVVMKDAIIPTLTSIIRAPKASPLADIDVDNLLSFFSEMMNISLSKDDRKILILDVYMTISETNPSYQINVYLTKLLTHLEVDDISLEDLDELINRAENLLDNSREKSRKNIEKLLWKLRQARHPKTVAQEVSTNSTRPSGNRPSEPSIGNTRPSEPSINNTMPSEPENVLQEITVSNKSNTLKQPQQVKRRKNRSKDCVVLLEKLHLENSRINKKADDTTLHTIVEVSMEMEVDNELIIETPTTNSKSSSRQSSSVIISETSDSDFGNEAVALPRKSNRCRKKRIL